MTAREEVLAGVRRALGRGPAGRPQRDVPGVRVEVVRAYRRAGERPADLGALLDLLVDRLVDYRATVVRCVQGDVAGVVATQLEGVRSVVVPAGVPDAWLGGTGRAAGGLEVRVDGAPDPLGHDVLDATGAVLTACRVAVAETGTIVLDGAPDQGRRAITLLPDRHVCVVRAEQVVAGVPEAVAVLGAYPERPLTWVSGPSATSDIELVRVEGVHGPRDLRVVVVEPARA